MSKKDYERLAAAIREEYDSAEYDLERYAIRTVAGSIATVLYQDNPRFNREKFLYVALGSM